MIELSLAYLFAAALIAVLLILARRNRQQGWRKQRGQWLEVEISAATAPSHTEELGRLQQSLASFGETTRPEPAKKVKPSVLV